MKNEADVKARVKKILKEHGVMYFMPYMAGMGRPGIADFVCCCRGQYVEIETKFGNYQQTAYQKLHQAEVMKAGGRYLLIDETTVDKLVHWL